jgi:serine phosphatase RsbU (regulator of sigma subunit)
MRSPHALNGNPDVVRVSRLEAGNTLVACVVAHRGASPVDMREAILASVKTFVSGAMPSDDMTVLVLRYRRP